MASVVEQTPVNSYVGDGATTVFPFEFAVLRASDLTVTVDGSPAAGITVAGIGVQAGGTVTFAVAPAVGASVVLERIVPLRRDTDYTVNGDLRSSVLDEDFNLLWQALQGQQEGLDRALVLPRGASADTELPTPEADKYLAWDSDAQRLVNRDASSLASVVIAASSYTDIFTPSDAQTNFTLTADPGSVNALDVSLYGVPQINGVDFTVSGTTLTMTSAPGAPPSPTARLVARYSAALPQGSNSNAETVTFVTADNVSRAVGRRLAEVVNVTDFAGVDRTGIADSSAGVQRAINYAVAQAENGASSQYAIGGVGIFFPAGTYVINTPLTILGGGVTLYGPPGLQARIHTTTSSAITLFTVGLTDQSDDTFEVHFRSLLITTGQLNNGNQTAIAAHRALFGSVVDCAFRGWWETLVGYRMNRWYITGNRFFQARTSVFANATIRLQGAAGGTGGGIHIRGNEFAGGGTLQGSVTAHMLFEECDGAYVTGNHTRDCQHAVWVAPTGAVGKNIIDTLLFANNYWDENHGINFRVEGTLAAGGRCQVIKSTQCYHRGANIGTTDSQNLVRVSLLSDGFDGKVFDLSWDHCTFRQARETAIIVQGSSSTRIEAYSLRISNSTFEGNLRGGTLATADIQVQAESVTLIGNTHEAAANASTQCVDVNLSDAVSGVPALIAIGNDFSKSLATGDPLNYSLAASGSLLIVKGNVPRGRGKDIDQAVRITTTNATTTTAWQFPVPQGMAGHAEVEVCGVTSDGVRAAVYTFRVGFRRNAGGTTLSSGTSNWSAVTSWNPDSLATPPAAILSTNTLQVNVTGQAGTTIEWNVHVRMTTSR